MSYSSFVDTEDIGLTKVKCIGISGGGRPSDGDWRRRIDLRRGRVELHGRDGRNEEEGAAEVRSISPDPSFCSLRFPQDIPELSEHGER